MDSKIDNMQKYENYRVQIGRLKKALKEHFYLEAIFIEYAIMEDRLEAILRHAGKWHPKESRPVEPAKAPLAGSCLLTRFADLT